MLTASMYWAQTAVKFIIRPDFYAENVAELIYFEDGNMISLSKNRQQMPIFIVRKNQNEFFDFSLSSVRGGPRIMPILYD